MLEAQVHLKQRDENGQSLVEFSISLVLLLILLSVIVDGARALFTYLSMRDAAQEGALYASYQPSDSSGIQARVCGASNMMTDLCGGSITITSEPTVIGKLCMGATGGISHGMRITISYPAFPLTMPFVGTFINRQTVPISVLVTDTILSPKCP